MTRRGDQGANRKLLSPLSAGMSRPEREAAELEEAAVELLETVLRRRRWTVADKDAVAEFLSLLIARQVKRRMGHLIGGEDKQ